MKNEISYARVKSDAQAAEAYNNRKSQKNNEEMAMIANAMAMTDGVQTILDAPCGVGRASIWLAQQGYRVVGVDLGDAALELARRLADSAAATVSFQKEDIFNMPYQNGTFDAILCFRLLHHFDNPALVERLISEMCRISDRYVIVSRITPLSVTSIRRRFRRWFKGKPVKQHPMRKRELDSAFSACGFRPVGHVRRSAVLHSLQLSVYEKK